MIVLDAKATKQECDQNFAIPEIIYPRTFVAFYEGGPSQIGNRTSAAGVLGDCWSTEEHAAMMLEYFEGFGVDHKGDPYVPYHDMKFSVLPYVSDQSGNVVLTSFYEYAEVVDTSLLFSSWIVLANADLNGPRGTIPSGYWLMYGMFR